MWSLSGCCIYMTMFFSSSYLTALSIWDLNRLLLTILLGNTLTTLLRCLFGNILTWLLGSSLGNLVTTLLRLLTTFRLPISIVRRFSGLTFCYIACRTLLFIGCFICCGALLLIGGLVGGGTFLFIWCWAFFLILSLVGLLTLCLVWRGTLLFIGCLVLSLIGGGALLFITSVALLQHNISSTGCHITYIMHIAEVYKIWHITFNISYMDISYEYMIYHMNIIIWTIIQGVTKYFPVCIQCHRLGSRLSLPRIYTWAGCCCLRLLHPGRMGLRRHCLTHTRQQHKAEEDYVETESNGFEGRLSVRIFEF